MGFTENYLARREKRRSLAASPVQKETAASAASEDRAMPPSVGPLSAGLALKAPQSGASRRGHARLDPAQPLDGAVAGSTDGFTTRYLARREQRQAAETVPRLSLPELSPAVAVRDVPGLSLPSLPAETKARTAGDGISPAWAQEMAGRYRPTAADQAKRDTREEKEKKAASALTAGQAYLFQAGKGPVAAPEEPELSLGGTRAWDRTGETGDTEEAQYMDHQEKLKNQSLLQRLADVFSGAGKQYGASLANAQASLYDLTQGGRDAMNRELLEGAQLKYDQAKRDYDETAALAAKYPEDKRRQRDLEAARNMLEAAERELVAYGAVPGAQRGATEKSYAVSDRLAESGAADIERAKAGLNGLGRFAADVGAGGLQLGADIAGGIATGGGTMVPLLLRSYGSGAQEARQEGASAGQAAAFGAASALTELLTEKISSLGNFQTKAFGSGALDDVLEGVVGAVERIGKTETGRKLLNHAASAGVGFLSEGAEEFVSGVVSPLLKRAAYSNRPIDWKSVMEDAAYEFLVGGGIGAVSGGLGGTNTSGVQSQYLSGVTDRAQTDAYRAMAENGMFSPEGGQAVRDALGKIDRARVRTGAEAIGLPRLTLPSVEDAQGPTGAVQERAAQGDISIPPQAQTGAEAKESGAPAPAVQTEGQKNTASGEETAGENGLIELSEYERANLSSGKKNKVISTFQEAAAFIRNALTDRQNVDRAYLGKIPDEVARRTYAETGVDIQGYTAILPSEAVRHIFKNHGSEQTESPRGQVAVTERSAALISTVLSKPDRIHLSEKLDARGRTTLIFEKDIGNYFITAQAVTEGKKALTTDTLYIKKKNSQGAEFNAGVSTGPEQNVQNDLPQSSSVHSVPQDGTDVNTGKPANMFTERLERMGESPEGAARLGGLLDRAADGGALTASEWSEIQDSPNGAKFIEAARMLAARKQTEGETNGTVNGENGAESVRAARVIPPEAERPLGHLPEGERLPNGRGERRAGEDPGRADAAVLAGTEGREAKGQPGGRAADDGKAEGPVRKGAGTPQSLKAIARQDAVLESGARMVSAREYMGLEIGSERPCLFDVPEEVIRSDQALSDTYDEIWEMGYRPHFFTGSPELESGFSLNGAVNGEDVYIRIDHSRHDADVIWEHEKFHILRAEDPGLLHQVKESLFERYGEAELMEKLETYLERYAGAYGLENAQGSWELSEGEMDLILEELLADAYAGKDAFRQDVGKYRDNVRDIAAQRESGTRRTRGPPEQARFDIRETGDGKKYVQADRQVITGQDPEVWAGQVEDYINYKIRHGEDVALLAEDGDALLLTSETAGKAKHAYRPDGSRMTDAEYETKLNAETHIDELARVSLRDRTRSDQDGRHGNFASKGWQYRKAYFRDFDGKYYLCDISVAQNEQGNVVYHVGRMRERSFPTVAGSSAKGGAQKGGEASYRATLPQPAQDVKPRRTFSEEVMAQLTGEDAPQRKAEPQKPERAEDLKTRFSIDYDQDNRPFVIVDEDILDGVPREDWVRTVKDNLRKKFPNGVTVGNSEIKINKSSRREMTYSKYMQQLFSTYPDIHADKLRATNNADEILKATTDWINEAPLHQRADDIADFARGEVQLRIGVNEYVADVVVGNRGKNGLLLYDIINLAPTTIRERAKKSGAVYTANAQKEPRSRGPAPDDNSISRSTPDVKPRRTFSEEIMAQLTGEDAAPGRAGAAEPKGLSLPTLDGKNVSKSDTPGGARFSADEDVPGLSLPTVEDGPMEANERQAAPAERRKAASRKLADDLAEIFPETSRKYLRDLADEIRGGKQGTGADKKEIEKLFKKAYKKARVYEDSPEGAELRDIAHELRGRRVYADEDVREVFGDDWKDMWWFFARRGLHITNDNSDMGLDALNKELASKFGDKFKQDETDQGNIISRLEYVLRQGDAKKLTLDEQARQYGQLAAGGGLTAKSSAERSFTGEEAVQKFREAYRQRFMDAAESYRDTMSGIAEDQRKAREEARQRQRQELEDYLDQARRTLRDRAALGKDTRGTDPRTHVPEGMTIDEYVQSLEQRAAQAREERLRDPLREEFRGSEAMEKLGIKIAGAVTGDYQNALELRRRQEAAEKARRAVRRAEKRMNATEAEKEFAAGITSGIYTENDIPRTMNADRVMELADYYMGERAFGFDMLRQRKADISRAQQEKAKEIFGPALEASEGKKWLTGKTAAVMRSDAFVLNNRTAERNMRSIFGDEAGDRINQWLFAPVAENEGERYRFVNRMLDRVREIEGADGKKRKLAKAESALVQKTIEGRAAAEAAASMEMGESIRAAAENLNNGKDMKDVAREFRLNEGDRRLTRQYAMWLETQEEIKSADAVKIDNAVELYSDLYGQFYEAINDFLAVHGYEPIGFIKGYAPHMQSKETVGALNRAFQSLGLGADAGGLPTAIAGLTKDFKPGKRWAPFFQTRRGEATDYDIVAGFERYVDHLSDVLYHTDDIARIREANKFLRKMYDQEEINERISQARELRYRTTKEKRDFLVDQGELDLRKTLTADEIEKRMDEYADRLYENVRNTTRYGQLAVWLDDYANMLAGKQVFADRDMERSFGRTSLNVGNRLTRAFTRAQVSGNLSSVLNQTSQLPLIQAEVGSKYLWHAMRDMGSGNLRKGDWALKSDFLTEKNGIDYITTSPSDMIVGAMFRPMGFVDGFLSTLAVRGRYLKEIDAGRSEAEAMRIADRYGREVMGSRAKGSAPLAFQSKNIFNRMLHAFQLEALNTWEHISQDLPRDYRAIAKDKGKNAAARALAGTALKILVGNFLLNRASEMLYGGTPAQGDVFGIIGNFVASGAGTTLNAMLKNLINAGWEKVMGEPLFDDDDNEDKEERPFDLAEAAKSAGSDMLNDTPLAKNAGALFGIGDLTLPMPDLAKGVQRTANAVKEDGLFSHEVMRQLMGLAGDVVPGGRQAEKTFQGLDTALRGGRYSGYGEDEKLMYPVDEDPFTALKAALFGNSALEETGEYYASGNKALSAEQTKVYKAAVAAGGDRKGIYNAILDWRNIQGDDELTSEEKARLGEEIVGETDLSDRKKLEFYKGLTGADSRADKLEALLNAGMDWDGAIGAYAMYDEIKRRENMTAGEKAAAFAKWADETYPAKQAGVVREQFVYYSMVPAQAGRYDKLTGAGLGTDTAYRLSEILSALEPEPGKDQISNMQKYQAIVSAGLSESDQLKAMEAVMSEGEYAKVMAGYEQGVTPELYVKAKEAATGYDENGNGSISQEEAKRAIKAMDGLTSGQKAALWQIQNKSWKPDNNPFNKKVGREVSAALNREEPKEDTESISQLPGLSLPSLR